MGKADYKVDFEKREVRCQGEVVATFDEAGELEYTEYGSRRKRWIQEVYEEQKPKKPVNTGPKEEVTREDLMEIRKGRKRMEDVFYDVPDPKDNKIGRDHPEVYAWVEKNYPEHMEMLYPRGKYCPDAAGVGKVNLAVQTAQKMGTDGFNMASPTVY